MTGADPSGRMRPVASSLLASPALLAGLATWVATVFVLLHLYVAMFGGPATLFFRPVHLILALVLVFVWFPLGRKPEAPFNRWTVVDLVLIAAAVWVFQFYLSLGRGIALRAVTMTPLDYAAAITLIVLVLEAVRRTVGPVIVGLCLLAIIYALWTESFPGVFYGPSVSPQRLISNIAFGNNGLFGVPLGVMANYVFLYILFGAMLSACGAGAFFNNLAFAIFGHRTGGPAKAAVVSSAVQGTISGSAISNVLISGSFTIPMMKRLGYRPPFAAGVEVVASNGGIITPPIMGAIAFMMAEFSGIPYAQIIVAAAVPAFLYFFIIFCSVHFEARRLGLPVFDRGALPQLSGVLWKEGFLIIPLVVVTATLLMGYSIAKVALAGIFTAFALSFMRSHTRLTPARLLAATTRAVRDTVGLSATCAAVGIIIAVFNATGLNFQITQTAAALAQSNLFLLLVITGFLAMVLGMGLSATAVYITMVATVVPLLVQSGIPTMAAHLFAIYFGIAANITPPVALAAYAAAPLAGANPLAVGLQAVRLGFGLYLLPFLFVYGPELLLIGTPAEIVYAIVSTSVALAAFAAAAAGFLMARLDAASRIGLASGAALVALPGIATDAAGFAMLAVLAAINRRAAGATPQRAPAIAFEAPPQQAETEVGGPPGAWALAVGWGVVLLAAVLVDGLGRRNLHSAAPLDWLAWLSVIAAVLAVVPWLLRRRPANPPHG